ncbi:hypothetical protein Droror1_Dr00010003 [Drosera rotundifolia]
MDFQYFASWTDSYAVDDARQYPHQMTNNDMLVHDSSSYYQFPPQKWPKGSEENSHLKNSGARNMGTTRSVYKDMDYERPMKLGRSGSCCYRDDNRYPDSKVDYGMRLCKFTFRREECPYGERCHFLHGSSGKWKGGIGNSHESGEKDEGKLGSARSYAISIKTSCCKDLNFDVEDSQNARCLSWKTKICNKWAINGTCPYGMRCIFAHGQAELRKNSAFSASISDSKGTGSSRKYEAGVGSDEAQNNKCSFKWERLGKTVGIYGDWINEETMSIA